MKQLISRIPAVFLLTIALVSLTAADAFAQKKSKKKSGEPQVKTLSTNEEVHLKNLFFDANNEKMLGNFDKAIDLFENCLRIYPQSDAASYELSRLYLSKGILTSATKMAENAVALKGTNKYYLEQLGFCYEKGKQYEKASEVFAKLKAAYPNDPDYYGDLANALYYSGKMKQAVKVYDELEEHIGKNDQVSVIKEKIYMQMGDLQSAENELVELLKAFPDETSYQSLMLEFYQATNQKEKAENYLKECLNKKNVDPIIRLSLYNYYRTNGDLDKGLEQLHIAFADESLDIDAKIGTLLQLYMEGEVNPVISNESYKLIQVLEDTHPDDAKTFAMSGDFYLRDNKFEQAVEKYRKANSIDNSRYLIWNQLLVAQSELRDYDGMLTESSRAIELFPMQPSFYLFKGIALQQTKSYSPAIEIFQQGINYVIDNPGLKSQFYSSIGDCYYELKNTEKAFTNYDKAIEINPNNVYVLNNYSYYLSLLNQDLSKAEKMSRTTIEKEPNSPSYLDTYGWILYQMQRYGEAKDYLMRAINAGASNNAVILEHYGDVLYKLNDKEGALKYWKNAKENGEGSEFLNEKIEKQELIEK